MVLNVSLEHIQNIYYETNIVMYNRIDLLVKHAFTFVMTKPAASDDLTFVQGIRLLYYIYL